MLKLILIYSIVFIFNGLFWYVPELAAYKYLSFYSFFIPCFFERTKKFQWMDSELTQKGAIYSSFLGILVTVVLLILFYFYVVHFYAAEFKSKLQLSSLLHLAVFAFSEELLFRGYFLEKLRKITSKYPNELQAFYSIFGSTVLFSLMHVFEGVPKALLVFIPGLLFGVLKWKTKNILSSFFSHFLCNLFYLLITKLPF